MSRIRREQCPRCAKQGRDRHQDNLTVYPDGHKFCFACGYHVPASVISRARNRLDDYRIKEVNRRLLPTDVILATESTRAISYLLQYSLGISDIVKYNLLWSEDKELLILSTDNWWCGKYLGNNPEHPKSLFYGYKFQEPLFVFNQTEKNQNKVILVEDFISAMKVSKVCPTVCLFGTHIPLELIISLSKRFSKLGVWLDMDKARKSLVDNRRALELGFESVRSIITNEDPKVYNEDFINEKTKD